VPIYFGLSSILATSARGKICLIVDAWPTKVDLSALPDIPERQIKEAFAEIIGEPTIPKDWGGERSDLFSDRVRLDGKRISTALMLKGPAQFAPLTPAGLGKNGDQIDRVFSERRTYSFSSTATKSRPLSARRCAPMPSKSAS